MEPDKTLTRVGQQHFHVSVGPQLVDIYNNLEVPFLGPYYDVIVDDIIKAGHLWIDLIHAHIKNFLDDEELEIIFSDLEDYAGFSPDPDGEGIYFELDQGIDVKLEECYGCVPKHTN